MRIVVAGGSGFLGGALTAALGKADHEVTVLTRRPHREGQVRWDPSENSGGPWVDAVHSADAVINLAGESIGGQRWTPSRKRALRESRVTATNALARAVAGAPRPPVFLSASGIGYYGTSEEGQFTEASPPGRDFLANLCQEWEASAMSAAHVARVVLLRTGVVFGRNGGALTELIRPFQFFAGGPIGSGRQTVSWIHIDDWVGMTMWALSEGAVTGALNLTAPQPVTNAELARAIGRTLHRPSLLRAPALAVRLAVGEMADAAVLKGQYVFPAKALALGYTFKLPELQAALNHLLGST
jgi:uncharacterized protein (TIGR01777 family)